jgi:hypothetical protein
MSLLGGGGSVAPFVDSHGSLSGVLLLEALKPVYCLDALDRPESRLPGLGAGPATPCPCSPHAPRQAPLHGVYAPCWREDGRVTPAWVPASPAPPPAAGGAVCVVLHLLCPSMLLPSIFSTLAAAASFAEAVTPAMWSSHSFVPGWGSLIPGFFLLTGSVTPRVSASGGHSPSAIVSWVVGPGAVACPGGFPAGRRLCGCRRCCRLLAGLLPPFPLHVY